MASVSLSDRQRAALKPAVQDAMQTLERRRRWFLHVEEVGRRYDQRLHARIAERQKQGKKQTKDRKQTTRKEQAKHIDEAKLPEYCEDVPAQWKEPVRRLVRQLKHCGWRDSAEAIRHEVVGLPCDLTSADFYTCEGKAVARLAELVSAVSAEVMGKSSGTVMLQGHGKPPIVCGREKPMLSKAQYDVVEALIDAGENGLTKDALDKQSGHGDGRKIMKRLAGSDPDWQSVLLFPGSTGKRYRIR